MSQASSEQVRGVALVTTSFRRDLERCRVLCESVDRFVDAGIPHYLLIDRRDVPLFEPLGDSRRRIIVVEDMLPRWLRRAPWSKRWWLSARTLPVRNWILQQIVKLSVSDHVDADAYAFVDSDVAFIRPFDASHVLRDGKVRLFRVPGSGRGQRHLKWHRAAARLLALPPRDYFGSDYIGNIITWRQDALRRLQSHVAGGRWGGWRPRLCNTLDFSEYILYGVFAEFVLGTDAAGHYVDHEDLCHCSWHHPLNTQAEADGFVGLVKPTHRAVLIQSNLGWDAIRCRQLYQAVLRQAELASDPDQVAVPHDAGGAGLDLVSRR